MEEMKLSAKYFSQILKYVVCGVVKLGAGGIFGIFQHCCGAMVEDKIQVYV